MQDDRVCLSPEEYVLFFDRLALVRKCTQLTGAELTTRTNVLLVRQSSLTPGNGVVLTYKSKKNTKRSHHQGQSASTSENSGARLPIHHWTSSLSRLRRPAVFTKWDLWESNNVPHEPQLQGPHQRPSLSQDPSPSPARSLQLHHLPVNIHHGEHTLLMLT